MHGRGNWQFFEWGTGFWKQLWLFQVNERCLLDVYKDNPVTRKVKNKYELNGQQDSLKLNACKSSESNERIGKWWRKKDKLVKFSYSTWERKQLRSVVRALSEVTACQTILQVLVVHPFLDSPLAGNPALDRRRWVKWIHWEIMMKWAIPAMGVVINLCVWCNLWLRSELQKQIKL